MQSSQSALHSMHIDIPGQTVCVFCGSKSGVDPKYADAAEGNIVSLKFP